MLWPLSPAKVLLTQGAISYRGMADKHGHASELVRWKEICGCWRAARPQASDTVRMFKSLVLNKEQLLAT